MSAPDEHPKLERAYRDSDSSVDNPFPDPLRVKRADSRVRRDAKTISTVLTDGDASKKASKKSSFRHLVAILSLSSIILANMNRQAFNNSLPEMVRQKVVVNPASESTNVILDGSCSAPIAHNADTESHDADNKDPSNSTLPNIITEPPISTIDPAAELNASTIEPSTETNTMSIAEQMQLEWSETEYIEDKDRELTDKEHQQETDNRGQADKNDKQSQNDAAIDDGKPVDDRFEWTSRQQGLLQSAFFYGYAPLMIWGARLVEIYGTKWMVFISGAGSALCCLLGPWLADTSFELLLASRFIMGLSQTAVSPAMFALCTRWLAPSEASVYLPLMRVGVMLGMLSGSTISGQLTWRWTFYVTGIITSIWSLLWIALVTSDPAQHVFVNEAELEYVQNKIAKQAGASSGVVRKMSARTARNRAAPWLAIFTNKSVLIFVITKLSVKMGTDFLSILLPEYLHNVFHVSQEQNSYLTSTCFAIQATLSGLVGYAAKETVRRKPLGLTKTGTRRLFQGICQFGIGCGFIALTFNNCNLSFVIVCLIFATVVAMFGSGGESVIPTDLTLDYSASIMAIANCAANFSGMTLPLFKSRILGERSNDSERWNTLWFVVGSFSIATGLLWSCFIDATVQDFDNPWYARSARKNNNTNNNSDDNKECDDDITDTSKDTKGISNGTANVDLAKGKDAIRMARFDLEKG